MRFLAIHFVEHLDRLGEVFLAVAPHQVEDLHQDRISQGIKDLVPFLPIEHDLLLFAGNILASNDSISLAELSFRDESNPTPPHPT